jgi:hypothetical protein
MAVLLAQFEEDSRPMRLEAIAPWADGRQRERLSFAKMSP